MLQSTSLGSVHTCGPSDPGTHLPLGRTMHTYILLSAYGWIAATGLLHFVIDVVSRRSRGSQLASVQATFYTGLRSSFALRQVALGVAGLFLASPAQDLLSETSVLVLSLLVARGWFAITLSSTEYRHPKLNAGIFLVLILAALGSR